MLLGVVEQARGGRGEIELARARALHLRQLAERQLDLRQRFARAPARLVDQSGRQPLFVVEQHFQDVLGRELLMAFAQRQRLRALDEPPRPLGVFFQIHVDLPSAPPAPRSDVERS